MSRIPGPVKDLTPQGDGDAAHAGGADEKVSGVFRLDTLGPNQVAESTAATKRKISTQIVVLGVVLVLGGGMLYGMRAVGIGPLKSLAMQHMPEYDMSVTTDNKTSEHKKVLEELNANHISEQVPPDQVQKNPFRMADALVKAETPAPGQDLSKDAEAARRASLAHKQKVQQELNRLKLTSVMNGSIPVAIVSGDAVRVGDKVGEVFTVKAIHGRSTDGADSVDLVCDGDVYTLALEDDNDLLHKKKK